MKPRIMIHITDLLGVAAGDDELENRVRRMVADLADELNSALPEYEVMLAHLDTDDYLVFSRQATTSDADRLRAGEPALCAICEREVEPGEAWQPTMEGAAICAACVERSMTHASSA